MLEDKILLCRECGGTFVFSGAEQEFYRKKGLDGLPKRCKDCRRASRTRQPLHKGICAACGRETRVPFRPERDRLVYCQDCYAQILAERRENARKGKGRAGGHRDQP